jgi:hypothetical protein
MLGADNEPVFSPANQSHEPYEIEERSLDLVPARSGRCRARREDDAG